MYTIYYDNTCIYNDLYPLKEYKLIDPDLVLEANNSGSLSFGLPITNIGYSIVENMKPLFKVRDNDELIWEGRAITETVDFNNTRTITCEGPLGYLNDTCQPQKEYRNVSIETFVDSVLSEHNAKVDDSKKIYKGVITVTDPISDSYRYTQFEKTLETINNLVETYGGYINIRYSGGKKYLDYYAEEDLSTAAQTIQFGVNLIDLTKNFDSTEMATVILPLGKKIASAGSTAIGEEIEFDYLNMTNKIIEDNNEGNIIDADDNAYKVSLYEGHGDLSEKVFYISTRQYNGKVMYTWYGLDDNHNYIVISNKKAGTGTGATDMLQEKITAPIGAIRLAVGGYGDDIPMKLYDTAEVTEKLDNYTTAEDYPRRYFNKALQEEAIASVLTQAQYDMLPSGFDHNGYMYQTSDTHKLYLNDVTNGRTYLGSTLYVRNEESVSTYGWIEKQITWDDVEDPETLYELATNYLTDEQFNQYSLEINAIDLTLLGVDVRKLRLLNRVRAISSPHGMDHHFPITKIDIHLNQPESSTYTLGDNVTPTLTSVNNEINDELAKKIASVPTMSETVEAAKESVAGYINSSIGGYVTLVKDPTGDHVQEIVISDDPDYLRAQKVWRWNQNGLMFSNSGYNGSYAVTAIDNLGRIVANAITTGTMSADRIRGGELALGVVGNTTGAMAIYDANGNRIAAADIGGVEAAKYESGNKLWVKMQENQLIFGNEGTGGAHSYILANYSTVLDGQGRKTIEADSECILLDVDFFGITTGHNSGDIQIGQTSSIDVITAVNFSSQSVTKKRLTFTKGILTGVVDI